MSTTHARRTGDKTPGLTHQVTVKLGLEQAETLDVLALLTRGKSQADLIRQALTVYYDWRTSSPELTDQIRKAHQRLEASLAPLSKSDDFDPSVLLREPEDDARERPTRDIGALGDPVTFKISEVDFMRMEALAVLDGVKLADVVRAAIKHHITERKAENPVIDEMVNLAFRERADRMAALK